MKKWKLEVTFIIGLLIGTFTGSLLVRAPFLGPKNPKEKSERRLKHFSSKLNLDTDQQAKVKEIFDRHRPQMDAAMEETRSKISAIREETKSEITKILTPEQQSRYIELDKKMEKRFNRRFPPPPKP